MKEELINCKKQRSLQSTVPCAYQTAPAAETFLRQEILFVIPKPFCIDFVL